MQKESTKNLKVTNSIKKLFNKKFDKDPKIKNAYLLVSSEKLGFHINIAEGFTNSTPANPEQPYYTASVGKLFTSVLVSILYEKEKLSFEDSITKFLDGDILNNLHVYKGENYTEKIQIRHLLNHTSGLYDHFYPLLEKVLEDPEFRMTLEEVIWWAKNNLEPNSPPGKSFNYSDSNYHLLGLIIENITGLKFHEALKKYIFEPLEMHHSYMLHFSEPIAKNKYPIANFFCKQY